jgi:hypothetical protein
MLFMSLDHTLYFWSNKGRLSNEGLPLVINNVLQFLSPENYTWAGWFVMIIAGICAPGLLFIAGYVLAMSIKRRQEAGTSSGEITKYLLKRGLILIGLQIFVASPAFNLPMFIQQGFWTNITIGTFFSFSILSTFGIAFLLIAALRFIKPAKMVAITAGMYLILQYFLPQMAINLTRSGIFGQIVTVIFALPVLFNIDNLVNSNFPVLQWILPFVVGWWFGMENSMRKQRSFVLAGIICFVSFVILRLAGVGEQLPVSSVSSFFVLSKYPPSPAYFLFYFSLVFFLMAAFRQWSYKLPGGKVLGQFGKVPLFFYNAHLWLYALIPAVLNRFNDFPFWMSVGVWLIGLIILFELCVKYEDLRRKLRRRLFAYARYL